MLSCRREKKWEEKERKQGGQNEKRERDGKRMEENTVKYKSPIFKNTQGSKKRKERKRQKWKWKNGKSNWNNKIYNSGSHTWQSFICACSVSTSEPTLSSSFCSLSHSFRNWFIVSQFSRHESNSWYSSSISLASCSSLCKQIQISISILLLCLSDGFTTCRLPNACTYS